MKYSYYPGCSLEHNAAAYHQSTLAVAKVLGLEFEEVDDWNCCGATEYIALNLMASYALVARNLAQASKAGAPKELVAPCSACYLNLRKCDRYMQDSPGLARKVNTALAAGGLMYQAGSLRIRHLLDVVVNDIDRATLAAKVTRPLQGLRVAPYYGCLIVRPDWGYSLDSTEYPTLMDDLFKALGAEVVDFPLKTHCCGGHMTQISDATAFELIRRLVKAADDYQADMLVTLCPMCQLNLDAFQDGMNRHFKTNYKMPVLYFTQLMGLAFGLPATALGLGAELVDARPALAKIGVEVPAAAKSVRPPKEALPMPRMPGKGE